jgi:hypothetical protein
LWCRVVVLTAARVAAYRVTELSSASFFGFIPRFSSTRHISSSTDSSQPTQPLCIVSSPSQSALLPHALSVSRDHKLRIWSVYSKSLVKTIDLPFADDDSQTRSSRQREPPSLLPPEPRGLVRVFEAPPDIEFAAFALVWASERAAFVLYGLDAASDGTLRSCEPIGERPAPSTMLSGGGNLRDFVVSGMDIWAVWERGGEGETWRGRLPIASEEDEAEEQVAWTRVSARERPHWRVEHFDAMLTDESRSVTEVFVEHLFYPGRYAPSALERALQEYTGHVEDPSEATEDLATRLIASVGHSVTLETNPQTGAPLYSAFHKQLKSEWLRFVSSAERYQREARFPLAVASRPADNLVLILKRDAISTVLSADAAYDHGGQLFKIGRALVKHAPPSVDTQLFSALGTPFTSAIDGVAADLYERYVGKYIPEHVAEHFASQLDDLDVGREVELALRSLARAEDEVDLVAGEKANASELAVNWLVDASQACIESRYERARELMFAVLFVIDDDGVADAIEGLPRILGQVFAVFHRMCVLRWIAGQSGAPMSSSDQDALENRFNALDMDNEDGGGASSAPPYSLLQYAIRTTRPVIALDIPFSEALYRSMMGFIRPKRTDRVVADRSDVLFAWQLRDRPSLSLDLASMWPAQVALEYVKAVAEVLLGRFVEAGEAFDKAAVGFCAFLPLWEGS